MYRMFNIVCLVIVFISTVWKREVHGIEINELLTVRPTSNEYIHTLPFPNSVFKYKFRGNETDDLFTLFEAEYLTEGPGHHIHTREDETFNIIDGNVQFSVDGKQFCATTGDYVYVPRNISQAIRVFNINNSTKPVRIQILLVPSGLEGFLDEVAPLYENDQNNYTVQNELSIKYGIINIEPVQWQDLGCFAAQTNSSNRLTSFFSSFVSIIKKLF